MEVLQRNGYEVLERVYATDGCAVFRGRHPGCPNCTQQVALKVQTFANATAASIIMREIENQRAFQNHPNVVNLFEYFSEMLPDGKYSVCLVVEWVTKDLMKDVQQRSKNNFPWPEAELIKIALALVQVLADAEQMGICHRDIKPQNIFFDTATQTVKLGDFGSSTSGVRSGVQDSTLVGTPQFMSKELKDAMFLSAVRISHDVVKSDVYALGLTLTVLARLEVPMSLVMQQDRNSIAQELALVQYSDHVKEMLWDMLNPDVYQRLTFVQLRQKYQTQQPIPLSSSPARLSLPPQSLSKQEQPQQYFQTVVNFQPPNVEAGQFYYTVQEGKHWGQEPIQSQYSAWDYSANQQHLQQPMSVAVFSTAHAQNTGAEQPSYKAEVQEECKVQQYQSENYTVQQHQWEYEAAQQYQREYEAAQHQREIEEAQQLQRQFCAAQPARNEYPTVQQARQNPAEQPAQQVSQYNPSQCSANYSQEPRASAAESDQLEQMAPHAFMKQWPSSEKQFDQSSTARQCQSSYLPEPQSQPAVASSNPNPQPFRQCIAKAPSCSQNSFDKCILCNKFPAKMKNVIRLHCINCVGMMFCSREHFETYVEYVTIDYSAIEIICCLCNTPSFWGDIEEAFGGEEEMQKTMKQSLKKSILCRKCYKKKAKRALECGDLLCNKCFSSSWTGSYPDCPVCGFKSPTFETINPNPLWKWVKKKLS